MASLEVKSFLKPVTVTKHSPNFAQEIKYAMQF